MAARLKSYLGARAWLAPAALLLGCLLVLAAEGLRLWGDWRMQRRAAAVAGLEVDDSTPPRLVFAKAMQLAREGQEEPAQQLFALLQASTDATLRQTARYNLGTLYLKRAAERWHALGVWDYDRINPLLDLAEAAFRELLREQPAHPQGRYNLEYALRIRPPPREQEERAQQGRKQSVFAILPGAPRGGP